MGDAKPLPDYTEDLRISIAGIKTESTLSGIKATDLCDASEPTAISSETVATKNEVLEPLGAKAFGLFV